MHRKSRKSNPRPEPGTFGKSGFRTLTVASLIGWILASPSAWADPGVSQYDPSEYDPSENALIKTRYYKYIGNCFSTKFHRPSCPFAKVMNRSHRVFFRFRRDAIESAYMPCRYCLPPNWKSVSCKVLNYRDPNSDGASDKSAKQLPELQQVIQPEQIPEAIRAPTQKFGQ